MQDIQITSTRLKLVVARLVIAIVWHATCTTSSSVELARDWVGNAAQLFLLLVKVGRVCGDTVLIEPILGLLDSFEDL